MISYAIAPEPEMKVMKTEKNDTFQDCEVLIKGLKKRDRKAVDHLYNNYSQALFGVAQRLVHNRELAEEVLHDVFMKIIKGIDSYDKSKGRLFTWMMNICRNAAIDKLKSKSVKKMGKTDAIENNLDGIMNKFSVEFNPDGIGLYEQLGKLHPDYFFVIDKLYFEGYSQSELAKEYEMPLGTVKSRTRAALRA